MNLFFKVDKMKPQVGIPDSACVGQMLVQCKELIEKQAVVVSRTDSSFNTSNWVNVLIVETEKVIKLIVKALLISLLLL